MSLSPPPAPPFAPEAETAGANSFPSLLKGGGAAAACILAAAPVLAMLAGQMSIVGRDIELQGAIRSFSQGTDSLSLRLSPPAWSATDRAVLVRNLEGERETIRVELDEGQTFVRVPLPDPIARSSRLHVSVQP